MQKGFDRGRRRLIKTADTEKQKKNANNIEVKCSIRFPLKSWLISVQSCVDNTLTHTHRLALTLPLAKNGQRADKSKPRRSRSQPTGHCGWATGTGYETWYEKNKSEIALIF